MIFVAPSVRGSTGRRANLLRRSRGSDNLWGRKLGIKYTVTGM